MSIFANIFSPKQDFHTSVCCPVRGGRRRRRRRIRRRKKKKEKEEEEKKEKEEEEEEEVEEEEKDVVGWLLNVPATGECISGMDLLGQFYVLPHTEIEVADQTFHLTQSQYTDTGPTGPSADPITPGVWQGSHWSANF